MSQPSPDVVAVATTVTLTFSHPMGVGTEMYAAVCEGEGMMGTRLAGTWRWSADRTVLTFHPAAPLEAHAGHTVHVGGGLLDGDGRAIDLEAHQHAHDGQWVTPQMVNQRMMSGMMMDMSGPGWQHENGTYGMYFTFTTS